MKITFKPKFKDQYLAVLTIQVKSPFLLIISLIFPVAGLFLLSLILLGINKQPSIMEFIIIPLALGFTPIISAFSVYMARHKNKTIDGSQSFIFDDTGLEISGSSFKTHLQWSALYKISETRRFFFFYISPRMAYYLPKGIFINISKVDELRIFLINNAKCKNNLNQP